MGWKNRLWAVIRSLLIAAFLTLITQVGGLVYLLLKPIGIFIQKKGTGWKLFFIRMSMYCCGYLLINASIIPSLAIKYNRVPLPCFANQQLPLKPANLLFCLANRHYVHAGLYDSIVTISKNVALKYPGTELRYLDANFPLFRYFPLLPHKSHNDGLRLDISFLYTNKEGQRLNQSPVFLGYGYCEVPRKGEFNAPENCRKTGYRLYSMLFHLTKHFHSNRFHFDEAANQFLLREIAAQAKVRKIFIEPHLKTRLGLKEMDKIRFHGCAAVRHDDHVHMEM